MSHRYSYELFVTALHERIQLSEFTTQLSTQQNVGSSDNYITPTHYQQYGRHPREVRKYDVKSSKRTPNTPPGGSISLNPIGKDGKRLTCCRCHSEKLLANRCSAPFGSIRAYYRERIDNGEPPLLLVSDLVKALEEDNTSAPSELVPSPDEGASVNKKKITRWQQWMNSTLTSQTIFPATTI